jgi:YspA, cpYpsA-related SLOG family
MTRVLVTGSRTWRDERLLIEALDAVLDAFLGGERQHEELLWIVHGGCPRGADAAASAWVRRRRQAGAPVEEEEHPASWHTGRGAGYARNLSMVRSGVALCVTFIERCELPRCAGQPPHGTHGAVHCATAARNAGIPVEHVRPRVLA